MSDQESVGDVENDLEIILDGEQPDYLEDQDEETTKTNENQENADEESKKVVKPKRVVKNPQPKLNEQTLKGPRGLAAIQGYFERARFKGRGCEEQDLDVLLKTYEYWCHRLFPKFPFDNCLERLEKLGTKKATQTHIKRIRMDLHFEEPENEILGDEEEINDTEGFVDTYNDQFDQLTATDEPEPEITEEQLERMRQNMEKARRLREEKLRKIGQNSQSTSEGQNLVSQINEEYQFNSVEGTSSKNRRNETSDKSVDKRSYEMDVEQIENSSTVVEHANKDDGSICDAPSQSETDGRNHEDNEDDIDNILDFINTGDTGDVDMSSNNSQQQSQNGSSKSKNHWQDDTITVSNTSAEDNSRENIESVADNTCSLMEGTT